MTVLEARGLGLSRGGVRVLHDVDLQLRAARTVCIVGPSGSGKTSLLRVLAGLEPGYQGTVLLDGRPVRGRACEAAGLSMVFQEPTLFPGLDVAQNIGVGLHRLGQAQAGERVELSMLRFGLAGLERRWPDELSGGQQRLVALARAVVAEPRVLLLDEPTGELDELARIQVVQHLRGMQRRMGTAVVHVTHDQAEAMGLADHLVVMGGGTILQQGPPREVFQHPVSTEVGAFLGRSNFLEAELLEVRQQPGGAGCRARVHLLGRTCWMQSHPGVGPQAGRARVMVRPHAVRLEQVRGGEDAWRATGVQDELALVQLETYRGDHLEHVVETECGNVVIRSGLECPVPPGSMVRIELDDEQCWVLPHDG